MTLTDRRGREGQRNLLKSSFKFLTDENGKPYATMSHDEASKNHPGGFSDQESYEKLGRMYKTEDPNDGFTALQLYLTKINPKWQAFFQFPKRNWMQPTEEVCEIDVQIGRRLGEIQLTQAAHYNKWQKHTNRFTKCGVCTLMKDHIFKLRGRERRVSWIKRKNTHLLQQSSERKKYYKHQNKAGRYPQRYFSIITDVMDQAHEETQPLDTCMKRRFNRLFMFGFSYLILLWREKNRLRLLTRRTYLIFISHLRRVRPFFESPCNRCAFTWLRFVLVFPGPYEMASRCQPNLNTLLSVLKLIVKKY
ncbi:hypothetical protein QZH41_011037 [Actinostola sp. cb2023]|nr:hypothetical protein QZH41_011037 [Actinostola sp. cb2023]